MSGFSGRTAFQDAYLLYQPYTYQNNAPFGKQSGASWALGITVPLPVYNRNQGNIERAKINVYQSEVQLAAQEKRVEIEVRQAIKEYQASRQIADRIRHQVLPGSRASVPRSAQAVPGRGDHQNCLPGRSAEIQ